MSRFSAETRAEQPYTDPVSPKVLHVVENLNRGAVENWLVRMLRFAVGQGVPLDWTFYCALGKTGELDEEVRKLGAPVMYSPVPIGEKLRFISALRNELRRDRYEVLHCHHDLISAVYLVAALALPIDRRIVHVHNADESVLTPNTFKQRMLRPLLRTACLSMTDRLVGISNHTLDTFLAGRPRRPERDVVHYYGVDPARFENAGYDPTAFRRELGLDADARLLLFAGRLVPEKNPLFTIDVLEQMRRFDPRVVGLFVGVGSLYEAIGVRVEQRGLSIAFRQLGWRDDLPEIMRCCDWFILPRPETSPEGFGLAVVEAQLAGLRLLLSEAIQDDPLLPHARYRRLPLAEGPKAWGQAAMDLMNGPPPSRSDAIADLKKSPMNMRRALGGLLALHGQVPNARRMAS